MSEQNTVSTTGTDNVNAETTNTDSKPKARTFTDEQVSTLQHHTRSLLALTVGLEGLPSDTVDYSAADYAKVFQCVIDVFKTTEKKKGNRKAQIIRQGVEKAVEEFKALTLSSLAPVLAMDAHVRAACGITVPEVAYLPVKALSSHFTSAGVSMEEGVKILRDLGYKMAAGRQGSEGVRISITLFPKVAPKPPVSLKSEE